MAFCFSWVQQLRSVAADARARRQAQSAIDDIRNGYSKLIELDLPEGAATATASIQQLLVELSGLVGRAQAQRERPWLQSFTEEQTQWLKAHPGCGSLLRVQVCKATQGSMDDMSVGRLAISDMGIAFDSCDIPGETQFNTSFVPWQQIASIERGTSNKELSLAVQRPGGNVVLRLKLSIPGDAVWIESFWRSASALEAVSGRPAALALMDATEPKLNESSLDLRNLTKAALDARQWEQDDCSTEDDLFEAEATPANSLPTRNRCSSFQEPLGVPLRARVWSTESDFASPWIEANPDSAPNMDVPEHAEPLCVHQLPDATLESIAALCDAADDFPFAQFLAQFHGASSFSPSKWARSCRFPSSSVRVLTFSMPLPQDLPRAVAMLINLPERTKVTNTYRLRKTEDEIVFISQASSPEAPFGANFRIQELNSFRALPGGGVECRKFVEVVWLIALPWGLGAVKTFAEFKILGDYAKGAGPLAEFLNDAAKNLKTSSKGPVQSI